MSKKRFLSIFAFLFVLLFSVACVFTACGKNKEDDSGDKGSDTATEEPETPGTEPTPEPETVYTITVTGDTLATGTTTDYALSLGITDGDNGDVFGSATLTASLLADGTAVEGATAQWASSNGSIATVTNGAITAVANGETTVTVTYYAEDGMTELAKAKIAVTVTDSRTTEPPATGTVYTITVTGDSLTSGTTGDYALSLGITDGEDGAGDVFGSATLTASLLENGTAVESATAAWASGDSSIATVAGGVVTAVGAGTTTITVTYYAEDGTTELAKATIAVAVTDSRTTEPPATGTVYTITVTGDTLATGTTTDYALALGITDGDEGDVFGSATLTASLLADGTAVGGATAAWASGDSSIATVAGGVVTAVGAGTTTITVTYYAEDGTTELAKATIAVTVTDSRTTEPPATGTVYTITVTGDTLTTGTTTDYALALGITDGDEGDVFGSAALTASLLADSTAVEGATAAWASGDSSIATVAGGVVTAVGAGTTTITVTYYAEDGTTELAKATIAVTVTDSRTTEPEPTPEPEPEIEYTITVTGGSLTSGTTTDYALSLGITDGTEGREDVYGSATLTASLLANGTADGSAMAQWASSDGSIATVTNGTITAVAAGTTTITVAYYAEDGTTELAKATIAVTVTDSRTAEPPAEEEGAPTLTVNKTAMSFNSVGATDSSVYTLKDENGEDYNGGSYEIKVETSAEDVATASYANGEITVAAKGAGSAAITVTLMNGDNATEQVFTISVTVAISSFTEEDTTYTVKYTMTKDADTTDEEGKTVSVTTGNLSKSYIGDADTAAEDAVGVATSGSTPAKYGNRDKGEYTDYIEITQYGARNLAITVAEGVTADITVYASHTTTNSTAGNVYLRGVALGALGSDSNIYAIASQTIDGSAGDTSSIWAISAASLSAGTYYVYSDSTQTVHVYAVEVTYKYGDDTETEPHTHTYDYANAAWEWKDDFSTATVTVYCDSADCNYDSAATLVVEAVIETEGTPATCTEAGLITYTATATFPDGTVLTDTQDSIGVPATGHTWGDTPVYSDGAWHLTCEVCEEKKEEALTSGAGYTFTMTSLEEINSAASLDGAYIVLGADLTVGYGTSIVICATITLDLNGHTIDNTKSGSDATGTVQVGAMNTAEYGNLTIIDTSDGKTGSVVGYYYAVTVFGDEDSDGKKSVLTVNGASITATAGIAISSNGLSSAVEIIINSGKISAQDPVYNPAIYLPSGTLYVLGGEISGATGIEVRGGKAYIMGGTITSTATEQQTVDETGSNGGVADGYAIAITWNESYSADALIEISGAGVTVNGVLYASTANASRFDIFAGTFSEKPDETFIRVGFEAAYEDGYYVVVTKEVTAETLEIQADLTKAPFQSETDLASLDDQGVLYFYDNGSEACWSSSGNYMYTSEEDDGDAGGRTRSLTDGTVTKYFLIDLTNVNAQTLSITVEFSAEIQNQKTGFMELTTELESFATAAAASSLDGSKILATQSVNSSNGLTKVTLSASDIDVSSYEYLYIEFSVAVHVYSVSITINP